MATHGRELLGEHYDEDHPTYEQIEALASEGRARKCRGGSAEELQGKVLRIVNRDDTSGYVVKNMESTGTATVLCYLQRA